MTPRARRWALLFAAWTVLVWATRIDNILSDGDLSTAGKVGRTLLAVSFVGPASALLVSAWRRRRLVTRGLVRLLVVWTVAVWVIRSLGIVTGDHDAAFVIVHLALATVSIALAARAYGSSRVVRTAGSVTTTA